MNVGGYNLRVARRKAAAGATTPLLIFNGIGANLELLEPFMRRFARHRNRDFRHAPAPVHRRAQCFHIAIAILPGSLIA